jgi:hypothetical protein
MTIDAAVSADTHVDAYDARLKAKARYDAYVERHPAEHHTKRKIEWARANPEKVKAATKRYRLTEKAKEKMRHKALKARYGITSEQRDAMVAKQGGVCAICATLVPNTKLQRVDHCHATKKVRGILCHHCNLILGHAHDNPDVLIRAAKYLEASK